MASTALAMLRELRRLTADVPAAWCDQAVLFVALAPERPAVLGRRLRRCADAGLVETGSIAERRPRGREQARRHLVRLTPAGALELGA